MPRSWERTRPSSRMTRAQKLLDLYHEKAGILDGDADTEVDLASYAYQIWKNAIDGIPRCRRSPALPDVVYSPRAHQATEDGRKAFSSICGPPKATTRSPGWTPRGKRHRIAVRHSSGGGVHARNARRCRVSQTTMSSCERASSMSSRRKSRSAGSWAVRPARASAPTNA